MPSLRTPEGDRKYVEYRAQAGAADPCALCAAPAISSFTHWKIVENRFPYDRIAAVHHMILPLRHVDETGLAAAELEELSLLKRGELNTGYQFIIEATHRQKSIPGHFHLHLVVAS
jgi:hypothetical protein